MHLPEPKTWIETESGKVPFSDKSLVVDAARLRRNGRKPADSWSIDGGSAVVVDGLNGYFAPTAAAETACSVLQSRQCEGWSPEKALRLADESLRSFQEHVVDAKSGACAAVASIGVGRIDVASTGDCMAALIDAGTGDVIEMTSIHARRHELTSRLGSADLPFEVSSLSWTPTANEILVLMTDGAWRYLGNDGLRCVKGCRNDAARRIVETAWENHTPDDATCITIGLQG